ncbi:hypothetical protein C4E44_12640 [Pseudomonas sp. MWU12-2312b]|nr:hypothetical protein C4E44_12640 [Pseudomonas sp. MWU12-2312b]
MRLSLTVMCPSGANYYGRYPGMWVEARSPFQVGTVVGLLRILRVVGPKPVVCRVSTGAARLG